MLAGDARRSSVTETAVGSGGGADGGKAVRTRLSSGVVSNVGVTSSGARLRRIIGGRLTGWRTSFELSMARTRTTRQSPYGSSATSGASALTATCVG